jgi:hypothetical protein
MAPGAPDPAQFLGIRLPVTFDTCEVIEERWAIGCGTTRSLRSKRSGNISAG